MALLDELLLLVRVDDAPADLALDFFEPGPGPAPSFESLC